MAGGSREMNAASQTTGAATAPFSEAHGTLLLAAVSGFVDTAGFILLLNIFTAHVTGNFVLAGAAFAGLGEHALWVRLGLVPVFMLAVMAASALGAARARSGGDAFARLLVVEAVALFAHAGFGIALDRGRGATPSEAFLFIVAAPAVIAMGVQNAFMRELLKTYAPTTMMTGNLTQFSLDLLAWLRATAAERAAGLSQRLGRDARVLGGFLLGAILGALGAVYLRFWSALAPALLVLALAIVASRATRSISR